jgi:L,D-transpeptidase ErfK/SrfK
MKKKVKILIRTGALLTLFLSTSAVAATYSLSKPQSALLGKNFYVTSRKGDTLISIAQQHKLGLNGVSDANFNVDPRQTLPAGIPLNIPTFYLLPALPHQGIIVNLAEMRMYYYPPLEPDRVKTYPIGIGKIGKNIPIERASVTRKTMNPNWIPGPDIRAYNEQKGVVLPTMIPPGPDNPLGPYAIYLSLPTFLIHSTIFPESIGRRASFGCIRMLPSDIEDFFPLVSKGTLVTIVDMPSKVGWQENELFLEVHPPLEEHSSEYTSSENAIIDDIAKATSHSVALIDWQSVQDLTESRDGVPHDIGFKIR